MFKYEYFLQVLMILIDFGEYVLALQNKPLFVMCTFCSLVFNDITSDLGWSVLLGNILSKEVD